MLIGRCHNPSPHRVLLDVPHTIYEFLFAHDLALVKAAHPHFRLGLQPEGEAALDELHGFFKRNIRSGRDQCVEMVRHDDVRVQEESPLAAIVEDGSLKQFRRGRDLKKAAPLRRNGGDKVRTSFLRCESHVGSINEEPVAKANFIECLIPGA